ncbi:hypothetical protein R1flu_020770 [Riccia fluitans]|uniref:Uncharacterized protein n=1 Tax=Riccia fluitans TaxID=41844 RepID=A0ABD1ZNM5_9MARC
MSIGQSHTGLRPLATSLPGHTAACPLVSTWGWTESTWPGCGAGSGGPWTVAPVDCQSLRDIQIPSLILTAGNYAESQIGNGGSLRRVVCSKWLVADAGSGAVIGNSAITSINRQPRGDKVSQVPAEVYFPLDLAHEKGSALNYPQREIAGERVVVQSLYPVANEMVRAADSRVRSERGKQIQSELSLDCRVPGLLGFQFEWGHRFLPWPGGVMITGSTFLHGTFGPGERRTPCLDPLPAPSSSHSFRFMCTPRDLSSNLSFLRQRASSSILSGSMYTSSAKADVHQPRLQRGAMIASVGQRSVRCSVHRNVPYRRPPSDGRIDSLITADISSSAPMPLLASVRGHEWFTRVIECSLCHLGCSYRIPEASIIRAAHPDSFSVTSSLHKRWPCWHNTPIFPSFVCSRRPPFDLRRSMSLSADVSRFYARLVGSGFELTSCCLMLVGVDTFGLASVHQLG